jgi:hypothetical protein
MRTRRHGFLPPPHIHELTHRLSSRPLFLFNEPRITHPGSYQLLVLTGLSWADKTANTDASISLRSTVGAHLYPMEMRQHRAGPFLEQRRKSRGI